MNGQEFEREMDNALSEYREARRKYWRTVNSKIEEMEREGWLRYDSFRVEYGEEYGRDVLLSPKFQEKYGLTKDSPQKAIARALSKDEDAWDEESPEDWVIDLLPWTR